MEEARGEIWRGNVPQNSVFAKEIYRAFLHELQDVTAYVQGAMTLAAHLPAVARLLDEIARVEISHYEQLGQLLLHLGITPALNTKLRQEPLRLGLDATTGAALLARRMMQEKIAEEQAEESEYRRLAKNAPTKPAADMLLAIAAEEAAHAIALRGMLNRFERA